MNNVAGIIAPFLELKSLRIRVWEGSSRIGTYMECLAQLWISQSRKLQSVVFPDMTTIYRKT